MRRLTEAQIDRIILLHRDSIVRWFDARFASAKHLPHPDRLTPAGREALRKEGGDR